MIGLNISGYFFQPIVAKPKPIAPYTCDFSRALIMLKEILRFLIGLSCYLLLVSLVEVITFVLAFKQSFENRIMRDKGSQLATNFSISPNEEFGRFLPRSERDRVALE